MGVKEIDLEEAALPALELLLSNAPMPLWGSPAEMQKRELAHHVNSYKLLA